MHASFWKHWTRSFWNKRREKVQEKVGLGSALPFHAHPMPEAVHGYLFNSKSQLNTGKTMKTIKGDAESELDFG
jgi:hypothetical protein